MYYNKVKYLIVIYLMVLPFTTILDSLQWTYLGKRGESITPMALSLLDDFIIFLVLIVLFIRFIMFNLDKSKFKDSFLLNNINIYYLILMLFVVFSCVLSMFDNSVLIILSGLRWSIPLLLIGLFQLLNKDEYEFIQRNILIALGLYACLNVFLQLFQLSTFSIYFGPRFLDISSRTIGFFREPNALSLLGIFSLYLIVFYMKNSLYKKILVYLILPMSIIASGSITPVIVFIFVSCLYLFRFNYKVLPIILIVVSILIYFAIPYISARPGLMYSVNFRLDIILDSITLNNILLSSNFGYGTNTGHLLANSMFVPESGIASLIINIGIIGTIFFLLFIYKVGITSKKAFVFFTMIVIVNCTNVVFESSPVNMLIAFELAYLIRENYLKKNATVPCSIA